MSSHFDGLFWKDPEPKWKSVGWFQLLQKEKSHVNGLQLLASKHDKPLYSETYVDKPPANDPGNLNPDLLLVRVPLWTIRFFKQACFVSLISFGRVDEAKGASMNHHQSSWIGNFNVTYALLLSTSRSERLGFFHQHNGLGWSGDRCGQVAPLPCCWWDLRGSNKCTVSAVGSLRFPSSLGLFFYPQKTSIFPWGLGVQREGALGYCTETITHIPPKPKLGSNHRLKGSWCVAFFSKKWTKKNKLRRMIWKQFRIRRFLKKNNLKKFLNWGAIYNAHIF